MSAAEIFRALGEPTRLTMVERLSRGPHTISTLSRGLEISRQGARKHIQILADSNIVSLTVNGRDTIVKLDRNTIEKSKNFMATLERHWEKRLEKLDILLKANKKI